MSPVQPVRCCVLLLTSIASLLAWGARGARPADAAAWEAGATMHVAQGASPALDETPSQAAVADASPGARPARAVASLTAASTGVTVRVGFAASGAYDVRVLPLEDYVARVLAGEAAPRSAPAALEALAITVRTFALANRARHQRDGFDLCNTTHCQVLREPYAAVRAAAAATEGLVLAWQNAPASVFYTASCGGTGERPSNVWPGAPDPPFLRSRHDSGCAGEPQWSTEISSSDLLRALTAGGFRGREIRDVEVRTRSDSGRVLVLGVKGVTPDAVSGQALRMLVGRTLGWTLIKSTDFQVKRASRGYRFTGRGFGHGVGFCVIGATRRAAAGATRTALLEQYFPGLQLTRLTAGLLRAPTAVPAADPAQPLASGDASSLSVDLADSLGAIGPGMGDTPAALTRPVRAPARVAEPTAALSIDLPTADQRDRGYVTGVVERALAAAAARTGRAVPDGIQLVFHPSADSFTRETGEPASSPAFTRGTRVDLQPYAALRERGALESTLAHEAAHLVTGPMLAGRARWVLEGAAMFAAGEIGAVDIAAARRRGPPSVCPADGAFTNQTAREASSAYQRARECFARALASDVRWDEVR